MSHILLSARIALLLAALAIPVPYRAPEPPSAPACGAIIVEDDNMVCWDYAVLYVLRTGEKVTPLYGRPDAATMSMLQSGDYGIAVATQCEAAD